MAEESTIDQTNNNIIIDESTGNIGINICY